MAVTLQKINGRWIVVVTHPTGTTSGTTSSSTSGSAGSIVAQAVDATAAENNATSSSSVAAAKVSGPLSLNQINQFHKNIINNTKVSHVEENGKFYKVVNGQKYLDWSDPRNSQRETETVTSTWYDIDTALTNVYSQAQNLGIKIDKPASYGKSITSASQAQKILDAYVNKANAQIAAAYNKPISNTKSSGGAAAAKVGPTETTYYDIADQIKSIQSTAGQYGVNASALSQTKYNTLTDAQKALNNYISSTQSAINAKITADNAAAKASATWKPSTIPSSMKADYDSWNNEIKSKYGKTLNPDYFLWLRGGQTTATHGAPKYYLEDALKEDDSTRAARAAADAVADAKFAASQKALQESYNAMLKAKGTSSNTNKGNNAANIKSSSYSKGTPSTFSNADNTINKIKVVKSTDAIKAVQSVTAAANKAVLGVDSSKATSEKLKELSNIIVNDIKIIKATDSSSQVNVAKGNNASAKYKNAVAKAEAATGKIQLANGKWVNQTEKNGASNPNTYLNTTVYHSSDAEKQQNAIDYQKKLAGTYTPSKKATSNTEYDAAVAKANAEAAKSKQLQANFKEIVAANGAIINSSQQMSGHLGTGAANVRIIQTDKAGNVTGKSKTVGQYTAELKNNQVLAAIPITSKTSESDKKAIQQAREYMLARTPTLQRLSTELKQIQNDVQATAGAQAPVGSNQFKTVDQLRYEKEIAAGGIGAALVSANKKFQDALSYKKAADTVSPYVQAVDSTISGYIPDQARIAQIRKSVFESVGQGSHSEDVNNRIRSNKVTSKVDDWLLDKYDFLQSHPVEAGAEVGKIVVESYAGGALLKGASLGLKAGTLAALEPIAANSAKIAKIAPVAGKVAGAVPGTVAAGTMINTAVVDTKGFTDIAKDLDYISSLAVGYKAFGKGAKAVETKSPYGLGLKSVDLKEVSQGSSGNTRNLHQGTTFMNVVSMDSTGLHLGDVIADAGSLKKYVNVDAINELSRSGKTSQSIITERSVQPFDASGERVYQKYLKTTLGKTDVDYYTAGKAVTEAAYNARNSVVNPKSFSILSTDVPSKMRATLTESIKSYGKESGIKSRVNQLRGGTDYKIQVAGSNAQKLQMGKYLTRDPGDLEIYVDNTAKFADKFTSIANKNGFVEGKDFKFENKGTNEPKLQFKSNGKWQTGVEIFNHNSRSSLLDTTDVQNELKNGFSKQEGIAYGFNELSSLKVDNIKLMRIQEQAARKFAGSTFLKGGKTLDAAHTGRVKDVRDLIEIGTANKVIKGTGKAADVVRYTKAAVSKYPQIVDRTQSKAYSRVAEFILRNDRLPTKAELNRLAGTGEAGEKEILFDATDKKQNPLSDILTDATTVSTVGATFQPARTTLSENREARASNRGKVSEQALRRENKLRSLLSEEGKFSKSINGIRNASPAGTGRKFSESINDLRRASPAGTGKSGKYSTSPSSRMPAALKEIGILSSVASHTASRASSAIASSVMVSMVGSHKSTRPSRSLAKSGSSVRSSSRSVNQRSNTGGASQSRGSISGTAKPSRGTMSPANKKSPTVTRRIQLHGLDQQSPAHQHQSRVTPSESPRRSGKFDVSIQSRSTTIPKISGSIKSVTETKTRKSNTSSSGPSNPYSHYQEGENQIAYLYMRRKKGKEFKLRAKKKKSVAVTKNDKSDLNIRRTIFNRLGSIETMFGEGSITPSRTKNPTVPSKSPSRTSRRSISTPSQSKRSPATSKPANPTSESNSSAPSSKPSKSTVSTASSAGSSNASAAIRLTKKNSLAFMLMARRHEQENALRKKKKTKVIAQNPSKDQSKMKRTIYNRLGSLDTMFGSDFAPKRTKQAVRKARKA